jgi:two-component system sensor histidine kinase KdpD
METERLRNSLLSSISHDLRTPLATIVGSASTLAEGDAALKPSDRQELSRAIYDESLRMANLVNNILDMARLDAGAARLNRQWHTLEEIVGTVLNRLQKRLEGRTVNVKLPRDPSLVHVDAVMIEKVLVNLLENAARYTPPGSPIDIVAERSPFTVTISVADRGPGIPKGQEERVFEKFYRADRESEHKFVGNEFGRAEPGAKHEPQGWGEHKFVGNEFGRAEPGAKHEPQGWGEPSGVGLGLAICRAIVEAHGGWIRAKNRGTGGAVFTFLLPQEGLPPTVDPEDEAQAPP